MHLTVSCLFLISSGWGEGGGSSAVMLLYRTHAVMLINHTGGVVWALKPPVGFVHKTTYATMIYTARLCEILLMRAAFIT